MKKAAVLHILKMPYQGWALLVLSLVLPLLSSLYMDLYYPPFQEQSVECRLFRVVSFFGVPAFLIFGSAILRYLPELYSVFLPEGRSFGNAEIGPLFNPRSYFYEFLIFWLVVNPLVSFLGQYHAMTVLELFGLLILIGLAMLPVLACFFYLLFQCVDKRFAAGLAVAAVICWLFA